MSGVCGGSIINWSIHGCSTYSHVSFLTFRQTTFVAARVNVINIVIDTREFKVSKMVKLSFRARMMNIYLKNEEKKWSDVRGFNVCRYYGLRVVYSCNNSGRLWLTLCARWDSPDSLLCCTVIVMVYDGKWL